jgi:formylglycine-generating enzyme required for sulfatase activity
MKNKSQVRIDDYNRVHLERLSLILRQGNVVGLVGAGASIACGYPGWSSFVNSLEKPLRRKLKGSYLQGLRRLDIRVRLDKIASHLGEDYSRIFKETFEPRQSTVAPWIAYLFDLKLCLILTTNYTSELENAARSHRSRPLGALPEGVRWFERKKFYQVLRLTERPSAIVYLHGRWDDSPEVIDDANGSRWSRIVLGEESYQYAYEYPGDVGEVLEAICRTHTVLIVGASLADQDVVGVLRAVRAVSGAGVEPHYAILPLQNNESPDEVADRYKRYGLQPLFYPVQQGSTAVGQHNDLATLLSNLASRVTDRITNAAPTKVVRGESFIEEYTGIKMFWVRGGRFRIGQGRPKGKAPWVRLTPFWVGATQVTNRQYAKFVEATQYKPTPEAWQTGRFGDTEQPVVDVSWRDAQSFCQWLSERTQLKWSLCSEAQWEYAARGTDGRIYPWGNGEPTSELACFGLDKSTGAPMPVGVYRKGRGPFGTFDQAGNVWEWCLDVFNEHAYQNWEKREPINPVTKRTSQRDRDLRVNRGGSWYDPPRLLASNRRYQRDLSSRSVRVGFRVVVNPPS